MLFNLGYGVGLAKHGHDSFLLLWGQPAPFHFITPDCEKARRQGVDGPSKARGTAGALMSAETVLFRSKANSRAISEIGRAHV